MQKVGLGRGIEVLPFAIVDGLMAVAVGIHILLLIFLCTISSTDFGLRLLNAAAVGLFSLRVNPPKQIYTDKIQPFAIAHLCASQCNFMCV